MVVLAVDDDDADGTADLRRCEADAIALIHRDCHVVEQLAQILVDLLHRSADLLEDRCSCLLDFQYCHKENSPFILCINSTDAPGCLTRLSITAFSFAFLGRLSDLDHDGEDYLRRLLERRQRQVLKAAVEVRAARE